MEETPSDEDDEILSGASVASSRATSGSYNSHDGMLPKTLTARPAACAFEPQRRCNRHFTFWLTAFLLVFVSTLTCLHQLSAREVSARTYVPKEQNKTWEEFSVLGRYYGGLESLVPVASNEPEFPASLEEVVKQLDDKNQSMTSFEAEKDSASYKKSSTLGEEGTKPMQIQRDRPTVECFLDAEKSIPAPTLTAYIGTVQGFPSAALGSAKFLNLTGGVCFDRFGRLGPYGYGYSQKLGGTGAGLEGDRDGVSEKWSASNDIDYREIRWADAQRRCAEANAAHQLQTHQPLAAVREKQQNDTISQTLDLTEVPRRIAVVLRTWSDYQYDPEDILTLRALLSELSLDSGAQFSVHFLIHVKDDDLQIWSDAATRQRVLDDSLPAEFHGLGTLWSERQMGLIYGGVDETFYDDSPVHGNTRSTFLPLQIFANDHPEFEHFWNLEMDVRYTGHFYELFANAGLWAKQQPRKGLWERNARFYIPLEHGSWEDFLHLSRVQSEHGTNSRGNIWRKMKMHSGSPETVGEQKSRHVWGSNPPAGGNFENVTDIKALSPQEGDKYEWGVGEEADLITFAPIFDPEGTNWPSGDDISGYDIDKADIPRRASAGTTSRLSRRLLDIMHRETALARHRMASEMWSSTCALHHGLKAVYVPHPVYIDRQWPTDYLAAMLNGGLDGAAGGSRTSVYGEDRMHNLEGQTWSQNSAFASSLWKRWLGYRVDGEGGEEWELSNEGRMCLPPMLLHPVKQVDMVFEHNEK